MGDHKKEFKEKYYDPFRRLYKFMERHYYPDTDDEWRAANDDLEQFKSEFEAKIAAVIFEEMERCYVKTHEALREAGKI